MLKPTFWLAAAVTALFTHQASAVGNGSPSVTLSSGAKVTGLAETSFAGTAINTYLGIPYTDAPVGDKRWKQSKLKTLTTDLNATAFGSICYGDPASDAVSGQFPPSEDCLYLNVWTPAGVTPKSNLPVMVWVYGGGFVAGAGNPYPGNNLIGASRQKVIVVNFNYRLGALGFLSNEEVLSEGDGANFGMRDQEVAFEWVKQNIRSFGGNPNEITAFGESAGSIALSLHLVSRDGNQKLFNRAIMQSGGVSSVQRMRNRTDQAAQTAAMAAALGCSGVQTSVLACLRKADAAAVFKAGLGRSWAPTIDKVFLYEAPFLRLIKGKVSRVPTISGANTDDGWYFSLGGAEASQFDAWTRSTFTLMNDQELALLALLYRPSSFKTAHHRTSEIFADFRYVCPSELMAAIHSLTVPNTYRYRFNFPGMALGQPLVLHAEDMNYVFDRQYNLENTTDSRTVVSHFQTAWTNFAIHGSPNGADHKQSTSPWPKYNMFTRKQIILQPTLVTETLEWYMPGHTARCAFWYALETRIASSFD